MTIWETTGGRRLVGDCRDALIKIVKEMREANSLKEKELRIKERELELKNRELQLLERQG